LTLPIYFDYAATTPLDATVLEAMMPYFNLNFGNPSSRHHAYGWLAEEALTKAQMTVAGVLNTNEKSVFFTSGATESINTVLFGFVQKYPNAHIISCKTEHKATLVCLEQLALKGTKITYLQADSEGNIDLEQLKDILSKNTVPCVLSLLWANNETGLIHPIAEIASLKDLYKFHLHVDATQYFSKYGIDLQKTNIDFLSFSGHKIYGPKGIGGLFLRESLPALILGGGQQRNQRAGTQNMPAIVGLAAAALAQNSKKDQHFEHCLGLKQKFEAMLISANKNIKILAQNSPRAAHISAFLLPGHDAEDVINTLAHKFAISNGSACNSAAILPSHVLTAMGFTASEALSMLRVSFGLDNTLSQVESLAEAILEAMP
jgi:cysteine desulfurase